MARRKDDYMTLSEAAEYAQVKPNTLRHAIKMKKLTAEQIGRMWVTTQEAVDAWLKARKMGRPPKKQ